MHSPWQTPISVYIGTRKQDDFIKVIPCGAAWQALKQPDKFWLANQIAIASTMSEHVLQPLCFRHFKVSQIGGINGALLADLEKGLEWCLDNEIQKVSLVGFSGLRDDHSTAALFSLRSFSEQMDLAMFTNFSIVHCTKGRSRFNVTQGQVISIIAGNSYTRIRSNGLKYELNNEVLFSPSNGVSNIALLDSVEIESDDWVWVFLNHME